MGRNTNPPQHPCAYIKYKYCGWLPEIPEITESGIYSLNSLTSTNFNRYKISLKNTDEYLVLEYRRKIGIFESNLPGEGIIIYRINENYRGNFSRFYPEIPGGIYDEVYAFRPDGSPNSVGRYLNANLSSNDNRIEFNNTSNPFCFISDSTKCNVSIENISVSGGDRMIFRVDFCDNSDVTYNSTSIIPSITEAVNISTNGNVAIEPNNNVTFEASNEIILNSGFETKSGSNFTALSVICGE